MAEFTKQRRREILAENALAGFENLWDLAHERLEPPNARRENLAHEQARVQPSVKGR